MDENDHVERQFGCCKILWKIENFRLATCKKNWSICSPEFTVRTTHPTSWKLILKPNVSKKAKDDYYISAYLKRLKSDSGPDIVRANWRISLLSLENNEYIFTDRSGYFKKNASCREDLENLNKVINTFQPFEADIIYVQCLLIVSFHEVPRLHKTSCGVSTSVPLSKNLSVFYPSREVCSEVLKKHEQGISSLSEDLAILYSSRKAHDVTLKIKDKLILAHRSILCARNSTLATIFAKNPGVTLIDLFPSKLYDQRSNSDKTSLPKVNSNAVERTIAYLYSGNLETVFNKPSVSIYECALVLDIPEVVDYYNPDELKLQSTVEAEEFVFIWIIADFKCIKVDCIQSPVFNRGEAETTWRLILLLNGEIKCERYISIFAEIVDGMKPLDVCLEFAVMDINGEIAGYKRIQESVKSRRIFGFHNFMKMDYLVNSFLENGALRIIFKLRQSSGIQTSLIECNSVSSITTFTQDYAFKLLSEDMSFLFETGENSDVIFRCGNEVIKSHNCILATRTTDAFFKFLNENKIGRNQFLIPGIEPEIFKIFLHYMYSSVVTKITDVELQSLLKLAEKFEMLDLIIKFVNMDVIEN